MKKPLFYIGMLLMCCCWNLPRLSANDTLMVRMLFVEPDSLRWIKEYNGFFNGKHPIRFVLGFDGESIRGISHYQQSNDRYILRGKLNQGKWFLQEQDELFRSSAFLIGEETDYSLLLDWHSLDQKRGGWLELFYGELPTGYRPNNVSYFRGSYQGQPANLFWQITENRIIRGDLYLDSKEKHYRVNGRILSNDGAYQASYEGPATKESGIMNGEFRADRNFLCRILPTDEPGQTVYFRKVDELEKFGIYKLDFLSLVEMEIPQLIGEPRFNTYIKKLVEHAIEDAKVARQSALDALIHFDPDQRIQVSSFSWFDIHYFDRGLISGLLTISHSWEEGFQTVPFNFDLTKGLVIDVAKIGEGQLFLQQWLQIQETLLLTKSPFLEIPQFTEWLSSCEWDLENFSYNGLRFNTPYHPVFGRQSICLPFEAFTASLSEDHVLKFLDR
ncbi:MAG: hypothetical protein AAF598_19765 [Bacteroidota bacterium]